MKAIETRSLRDVVENNTNMERGFCCLSVLEAYLIIEAKLS